MIRTTAKRGAGPQTAVVLGRNGVLPKYPKNASPPFDDRLPIIERRAHRNAARFVDDSTDLLFRDVKIAATR